MRLHIAAIAIASLVLPLAAVQAAPGQQSAATNTKTADNDQTLCVPNRAPKAPRKDGRKPATQCNLVSNDTGGIDRNFTGSRYERVNYFVEK